MVTRLNMLVKVEIVIRLRTIIERIIKGMDN